MGIEIERKFLVRKALWSPDTSGTRYRQGYLCPGTGVTVRIRIAGNNATLTIKGPSSGFSRSEYEYSIPLSEAEEMLDNLCHQPLIEKTRYRVEAGGRTWEVDEFHGANSGLVLAEIELERATDEFSRPAWLGDEVSHDSRFFNSALAREPQPDANRDQQDGLGKNQ